MCRIKKKALLVNCQMIHSAHSYILVVCDNDFESPANFVHLLYIIYNTICIFYSGYPPTPTTPGTNQPNGGPPPEALSAAALVAAAATATATATATAVMGMQEQQRPQMNMNVNMNMNQHQQYPQV